MSSCGIEVVPQKQEDIIYSLICTLNTWMVYSRIISTYSVHTFLNRVYHIVPELLVSLMILFTNLTNSHHKPNPFRRYILCQIRRCCRQWSRVGYRVQREDGRKVEEGPLHRERAQTPTMESSPKSLQGKHDRLDDEECQENALKWLHLNVATCCQVCNLGQHWRVAQFTPPACFPS